jgi:hypothetical protein
MKIPLINNKEEVVDFAIVDEDDFAKVAEYNWSKTTEFYANATINGKPIRMHQFIIGKAPLGQVIDHINGNKLDNRRENLQFCTKKQNGQNIEKKENTTSQYKGVSWNTSANKWIVGSKMDGKQVRLGTFDDEIEAACTYDTFVLLHYGANAKTNGFINYDNIKDIDINTLIKTQTKKVNTDIPKYIFRQEEYFQVSISYKTKKYRKTVTTLELAIEQLKEFQDIIDKIKKEEKDKHFKQEILRNENGDAIIPMKNKKGDIIDHLIVSDNKWHEVMQYTWSKTKEYFRSTVDGKMVKIHHYIMNVRNINDDEEDILVDHIDHNPKNNKDDNLRLSNSVNNNHNRTKKPNASSKYLGVSFNKSRNKFYASIRKDDKTYNLGSFENEIAAALAYNFKATELYGEFANLNIIDDDKIIDEEDNLRLLRVVNNDKSKIKKLNCSSKYFGVSFHKRHGKFLASIKKNGKQIHIGSFKNENDAAIEYNKKATEFYGENATLNIIEEN